MRFSFSLSHAFAALALFSVPCTGAAWTFGDGPTYGSNSSISADGRYVAFASDATNLIPNDANNASDIFVLDNQDGSVVRVSKASDGTPATNDSYGASISADGTKVAFYSYANNLVPNDTNIRTDIFVHDLVAGTTVQATVDSLGNQANSAGNGAANPSMSADGTKVAYHASADNLVAGDTNGVVDIFVHNLVTGETVRASVTSTGGEPDGHCYYPSLSGDGNHVAFVTQGTNLVPGDGNGYDDVFVRDLVNNTTTHVSVADDETPGNQHAHQPSISHNGNKVAFASNSMWWVGDDNNFHYDVFVRDIAAGTTVLASRNTAGNVQNFGVDYDCAISADGTHVAFATSGDNVVAGDTPGTIDVFVRNLTTGVTTCASQGPGGVLGNGTSKTPALNANGNRVSYISAASNLVAGDTNGQTDMFVYDLGANNTSVPVTVSQFSME